MRAHPHNPGQYYSREEWRFFERQNGFRQDSLWHQCRDEASHLDAVYQQVAMWNGTGINMHCSASIHRAATTVTVSMTAISGEVNWKEASFWEVLTDSGWQFYEPKLKRILQLAIACGREAVHFQRGSRFYWVHFDGTSGEAVQVNTKTKATRVMRNTRLQAAYQRHVAHVLVSGVFRTISSQVEQQETCGYSAPGTPSLSSEVSTDSVMGNTKLDGSNYVAETHEALVDSNTRVGHEHSQGQESLTEPTMANRLCGCSDREWFAESRSISEP